MHEKYTSATLTLGIVSAFTSARIAGAQFTGKGIAIRRSAGLPSVPSRSLHSRRQVTRFLRSRCETGSDYRRSWGATSGIALQNKRSAVSSPASLLSDRRNAATIWKRTITADGSCGQSQRVGERLLSQGEADLLRRLVPRSRSGWLHRNGPLAVWRWRLFEAVTRLCKNIRNKRFHAVSHLSIRS